MIGNLFLSTAALMLFAMATPTQAKLPKVVAGQPLPSDIFVELSKKINPTVVNISTRTEPKYLNRRNGQYMDPMEELLRQFFGGGRGGLQMPQSRPHSLGTGFIIRKDGLILTNAHVISQADIIDVQLTEKDEKSYTAKVIGKDTKTDIALIKIEAPFDLPVATLGESASLQVGEWVTAFGNPFGHGHTVTKGIVSAIGRDLEDINLLPFIQTDASINPGNSGGPLVNLKGEVIGVNTAIDARAQGIGFAIPIDEVKSLISQLEKNGEVKRGFLGVQMQSMNPAIAANLGSKQKTGALIVNVINGSAASKAGLKAYDIIVKFNGRKIKDTGDLSRSVSSAPLNKKSRIDIIRNNRSKSLYAHLGTEQKPYAKKVQKKRPQTSPAQGDFALKTYGFKIDNLNSKIKRDFEINKTGKHKAVITRVVGYSKASQAGLRAGDVIYEINRKPIFTAQDAESLLKKPNQTSLLIRLKRGKNFLLVRLEK